MMETISKEQPFFSAVLEDHLSRFPTVPSFFIENSSLADFLINEELAKSPIEAIELLESHYSFDAMHVRDEWYCTYEPSHNLWIFNRILSSREAERKEYAECKVLSETLKQYLFDISPRRFEDLIFELFRSMTDYEDPIARPMTRDGGYEMCVCFKDPVTNSRDRILVQAKHENKPVSVSHTRELIGTLAVESRKRGRNKRLRGLLVSLLPPTPDSEAAAEASHYSIDFLTAGDLVKLMIRHNVGCTAENHVITAVDKIFWDELRGGFACLR